MNNLLIEVYVPAINTRYDVFIPYNARVYELLPLISSAVEKLSGSLFSQENNALCDGETGRIYNNSMTVGDMDLKNGSRMMLI